jgi:predicted TIM-barrel fold metal-dependent hydrolase
MLAGPSERPLWDGRVEDPAPGLGFEDWLGRLRQQMDLLGFTRVVVVQSILYGTDNTVALDAVRRIGDGARAVALVIDHAGWPRDMGAPGVELMSRLLAEGRIWAKLSGIYRLTEPPWTETDPLVRQIVEANPERCLWGSDWPHIMLADAAMPDAGLLLDAFMRAVEDPEDRQRVLVDNPAALFGF